MTQKHEVTESVEPMGSCPKCNSERIDGPFGMDGSMNCLDCGHNFTDEAREWCIGEREARIHKEAVTSSSTCGSCGNELYLTSKGGENICFDCMWVRHLDQSPVFDNFVITQYDTELRLTHRECDQSAKIRVEFNPWGERHSVGFYDIDKKWEENLGLFEDLTEAVSCVLTRFKYVDDVESKSQQIAEPLADAHTP